ncbi:hypothetical protein Lal_00043875 [Lupinus albus]|uniref:Uncharacterized protein n=1 Tax=Lupinus albus TaxID=3870 RepID=A0A6A5PEV9_LUPAL|nr:hypothetical protein Lalb_Chr15g0089501 [Lupinus albus]KAF1895230.1 hypothetical protein Lal_00043875 [Lupinus albus]
MAPLPDLAISKNGYETDKLLGDSKGSQNLCQYKFYPTYGSTMVVQIKVEDFKCNDNITKMHIKGVVGQ